MKFKSNNTNNVSPVCIEDVLEDMAGVMNMGLEEAVEHLDDLEILYNNIERFGITEPVMHLVGGTLESWSIDISNKEVCLEGLGDKIKEAAAAAYEFIKKIIDKIIAAINKIFETYTGRRLADAEAKLRRIKSYGKRTSTYGIPDKKSMERLISSAKFFDLIVDDKPDLMAIYHLDVIKKAQDGTYKLDERIEQSMNASGSFELKGYTSPVEIVQLGRKLGTYLQKGRDNIEKLKKRLDEIEKLPIDKTRESHWQRTKYDDPDSGNTVSNSALFYRGDKERYIQYLKSFLPCLTTYVSISSQIYMRATVYAEWVLSDMELIGD